MELPDAAVRVRPAADGVRLRPLVAVVTFLLVLVALVRFGATAHALGAAMLLCLVAVLAVIDLEERRVPNRIVLPATAAILALRIALDPGGAPELVGIALAAGLFFFLPLLVSPGGMGMGDVKLAVLLGAALGQAVVAAIGVAVLAAFVVALGLLVRDGAAARKSSIAFAPYLALGAAVAVLLG